MSTTTKLGAVLSFAPVIGATVIGVPALAPADDGCPKTLSRGLRARAPRFGMRLCGWRPAELLVWRSWILWRAPTGPYHTR
jgi:hypothetical protein